MTDLSTTMQVCYNDETMITFTVCVLLYGDNLKLAERCLCSITPLPTSVELRIGLNEVSQSTRSFVDTLFKEETAKGRSVLIYSSTTNRGKYPMMRWMLHDMAYPIHAPYIMWFDDDSFIKTPSVEWLMEVQQRMMTADICGEVMRTGLMPNQALWIQMQPWYNGLTPVQDANGSYHVPQFIVGGWWTIYATVIRKLNWPPPNIIHRGGDYMLGEALRQHGLKLASFTSGLAIDCSEEGHNHKAKRRGIDPLPVGMDFNPSLAVLIHAATKDIEPCLLDYPGL